MGAGAHAQVIMAVPVNKVVPALVAGPGEIRYFVIAVPLRLENLPRAAHEPRKNRIIGKRKLSFAPKRRELGAGFDRKAVGGYMGRGEAHGGADIVLELFRGLPRASVYKIKVVVAETGVADIGKRADAVVGSREPPVEIKLSLRKGLHADAYPVHPDAHQRNELFPVGGSRVCLKAHFRRGRKGRERGKFLHYRPYAFGPEKRRGPSPEKHRAYLPAFNDAPAAFNFPLQGADVIILGKVAISPIGVKITIRALGKTVRNMDIHAKGRPVFICILFHPRSSGTPAVAT